MTTTLTKPWEKKRPSLTKCKLCGEVYISGTKHKCKPKDPFCRYRPFEMSEETRNILSHMDECMDEIRNLLRFKIKQE